MRVKKVRTPGSYSLKDTLTSPSASTSANITPSSKRGKGRPVKRLEWKLTAYSRKDNYRSKYTQEQLNAAIAAYTNKRSIRDVAKEFGVPKSTLENRLAGKSSTNLGRPKVLSDEEERIITERILVMADWGFPLAVEDVKHIIRDYLNSMGRNTRLRDNLPGKDFIAGFLKRNPILSKRTANNIKRSRAKLSPPIVKDFFERYKVSAAGIPASNVFNYDETNLTNDPGVKKALFRRGTKYAERVMDGTKASVSVMFCASANGVLLPPYVVYQGQNTYPEWTNGGIDGSAYNSSKSGWFDMFSFTDWFERVFLKHARRLEGKKLLIGDNLASHISSKVIQQCSENDIVFLCLPPNSTDKMQPLDVGFFGPMKRTWRRQLQMKKEADPKFNALKKQDFPVNLRELIVNLNPKEHMPKAFEKCGLFPINPEKVLERLPSATGTLEITTNLDEALLKKLETSRYGDQAKKRASRPKGKKIPAGTSYIPTEEAMTDEEAIADELDEDAKISDKESNTSDDELDELPDPSSYSSKPACIQPGQQVAAIYEGEWFLAEVSADQIDVANGYTRLNFMAIRGKNMFAWGKQDVLETLNEDIILTNVQPIPKNNRGYIGLNEEDLKKC